jgi:hypothetical protein
MNRLFKCGILLVLFPGSLPAGLQFTLTPSVQPAAAGTQITFNGTLTNDSNSDNLLLNDIHFDLSGAASTALTPDPNSFFSNVPGLLLPGETYTGPIFTVTLSGSAGPGDYSGTVTVRGGSTIFVTTDLQGLSFQLSSPSVTMATTTADAYEFGPVSGTITISRTGSTNYDLPVQYAVNGSAANGVRYAFLSGNVTIPTGSGSIGINVVPIPNDIADGDQTVSLTITSTSGYNIGATSNGTVTIHDKPIDAWRLEEFGSDANTPAVAGDTADPDGDGIANLMEYGLGSDPHVISVSDLPLATIAANHLQLSFQRNTNATDVTYIVEASADLSSNTWSAVMTRSPGGNWIANLTGATANETGSGQTVDVTITDPIPIIDPNTSQPTPKRFLRLRLQH